MDPFNGIFLALPAVFALHVMLFVRLRRTWQKLTHHLGRVSRLATHKCEPRTPGMRSQAQIQVIQEVEATMRQKRLQHWRDILPIWQSAIAAGVLVRAVTLPGVPMSRSELVAEVMKCGGTYVGFAVLRALYCGVGPDTGASGLCSTCMPPQLLACLRRARTPTFAYCYCMAWLAIDSHTGPAGFTLTFSPVFRVVFSLVNKNPAETVIGCCLVSIVNLVFAVMAPSAAYFCGQPLPQMLFLECAYTIGAVFTASTAQMLLKRETFSEIRAKNEHSALTSILNASCDTVLQMDEEWRIVGQNQRLAAMLFRTQQELDGESFMSLVASEDRDRVQELLRTQRPGEIASGFGVDLLDCWGRLVKTTGFHAEQMDVDGTVKHVVGLTEVQEETMSRELAMPLWQHRPSSAAPQFPSAVGVVPRLAVPAAGSSSPESNHSDAETQSSEATSAPLTYQGMPVAFIHSGWRETPPHARKVSLHRALTSWNLRLVDESCCPFHEAVVQAIDILYQMQGTSCMGAGEPVAQCAKCRLINTQISRDGVQCDVCAGRPQELFEARPAL